MCISCIRVCLCVREKRGEIQIRLRTSLCASWTRNDAQTGTRLSPAVTSFCQCSFDSPFSCSFCIIHFMTFVTAGALAYVWLASFQKLCFGLFFNTAHLYSVQQFETCILSQGYLRLFSGKNIFVLFKPIAIRCTQDKSASSQGWWFNGDLPSVMFVSFQQSLRLFKGLFEL